MCAKVIKWWAKWWWEYISPLVLLLYLSVGESDKGLVLPYCLSIPTSAVSIHTAAREHREHFTQQLNSIISSVTFCEVTPLQKMRNFPHRFRSSQSPPSVSFHIEKENTVIIHTSSDQTRLRSKTDINWGLCWFWGTLILGAKNNKQSSVTLSWYKIISFARVLMTGKELIWETMRGNWGISRQKRLASNLIKSI